MPAVPDIQQRLYLLACARRVPAWTLALLPWVVLASDVGVLAAVALVLTDAFILARRLRSDWPRWLDDAWPEMEDSAALLAGAATPVARLQRERIGARLPALLSGRAARVAVAPKAGRGMGPAMASVLLAGAAWAWPGQPQGAASPGPGRIAAAAERTATLVLRIEPPAYTGIGASESAPRDLQVPAHSVVRWCARGGGTSAMPPVELSDGQKLAFEGGCAQWKAGESVFWRWEGMRHNLHVTPDLAPQVVIAAPRDILSELDGTDTEVRIALSVEDDYSVARATLHMTLARGSGENVRFSDRELPVPAGKDPRRRRLERSWTLSELGMEPGDELYFFVRAADNASPPQATQSPTYTLRLPGPVGEGEAATALPSLIKPENLRSQRQIIIDTEQLLADMRADPRMSAASIRARSEEIAFDQGMLRRRYGQFLGEESTLFGDEEHSEEEEGAGGIDVLHDYGHAHDNAENATLFDEATKKILRRALAAMWDAEKALRATEPRSALKPEHVALEAIKELQQADRIYLHRTAFAPPPIKEEIRMTGDTAGSSSYRRGQDAYEDGVPTAIRSLMLALSGDGPLPALWSRDANEWIRERIRDDARRLAAQRAVQDVGDGCASCRPALKAWLRAAIGEARPLLQAQSDADTPFSRNLREGTTP